MSLRNLYDSLSVQMQKSSTALREPKILYSIFLYNTLNNLLLIACLLYCDFESLSNTENVTNFSELSWWTRGISTVLLPIEIILAFVMNRNSALDLQTTVAKFFSQKISLKLSKK